MPKTCDCVTDSHACSPPPHNKQRCFDDLRVDEESLLEKGEWDYSFCDIIDDGNVASNVE